MLPVAVQALYVEEVFNKKSTQHTEQLVENIRSSLVDILNNAAWMDKNTKKAAVDKAKAIVAHIAYPKDLTNKRNLKDYYEALTLDENEFFMNVLRVQKFEKDYAIRQLHRPMNKTDWLAREIPITKATAFYIPSENSIGEHIYYSISSCENFC